MKNNSDIRLTAFFGAGDVLPHCGELSRDEIIRRLVEDIYRSGRVPPTGIDETVASVLSREKDGSTVIMDGLALPHARIEGLAQPRVAVATSERGVVWPSEDSPVHVVFATSRPSTCRYCARSRLRSRTTPRCASWRR